MSALVRLVLVSSVPEEAQEALASFFPVAPSAPAHIHAGAALLGWAKEQSLSTCPACSSDVGRDHLSRCYSHYAKIAEEETAFLAKNPPTYFLDSTQLTLRLRELSSADDYRIVLCAHPCALPPELPPPWAAYHIAAHRSPEVPSLLSDTGGARRPTSSSVHILRGLGYTDDQISDMTAALAAEIITLGIPTPAGEAT